MGNDSQEKKLYRSYASSMDDILKEDEEAKAIFDSLASGENTYLRVDKIENTAFDLTWIEIIEGCLNDLGTIVMNPRLATKVVSDVVPIELAKKTNGDSVKHLASHTQYIKDIKENGDVIPSKILNIGADDDLHTYENRFIATVIRRLVLFVEKRYEYVKNYTHLHDEETLYFKNHSAVKGSEVSIETRIKVRTEKNDPNALKNEQLIARIGEMRHYILYYYRSDFMKELRTERDVRNPILQTNIIRKNPVYHHCYQLYRFLEAYDQMGASYMVKETFTKFNEAQLHDLNELMMANYLALGAHDRNSVYVQKERSYQPKILTSTDDEEFEYGALLKGPVKFVRVDSGYQKYLDGKVNKDLPEEPTPEEKEYFKDEYAENSDHDQEVLERTALLRRKSQDKINFDEHVKGVIKRREKEEEEYRQYLIEKRLREEDEYIDIFRQRLADEARKFRLEKEYAEDFTKYHFAPANLFFDPATNTYNYTIAPGSAFVSEEKADLHALLTGGLLSATVLSDRFALLTAGLVTNYPEDRYSLLTSGLTPYNTLRYGAKFHSLTDGIPLKADPNRRANVPHNRGYVVFTLDGFYVNEDSRSYRISEAKVFSLEEASLLAKKLQGKKVAL